MSTGNTGNPAIDPDDIWYTDPDENQEECLSVGMYGGPKHYLRIWPLAAGGKPLMEWGHSVNDKATRLMSPELAGPPTHPAAIERVARYMFLQEEIHGRGSLTTMAEVDAKWDLAEPHCQDAYDAWREQARALLAG